MQSERKLLGIIEILSAGFDAVARAPQVMIVPILLDLFLWLGPRLSAYGLLQDMLLRLSAIPDEAVQTQAAQLQTILEQVGPRFNMFSWLSPLVLGVPSLVAGALIDQQPWIYARPVWEIDSGLAYFGLFGLFSVLGLGLNALYWSQVAHAVRLSWPAGAGRLAHAGRIWLGLLQLAVVLISLGLVMGLPVLVMVGLAGLFNPWLAQLGALTGLTMMAWVVLYLAFVIHGVALRERGFLGAVRISLALVHSQFLPAGGLVMLGLLIYWGLGLVWTMPSGDSWLMAGAILGNAFVGSGVLCATAVFYLDRVPEQERSNV